MTELKEVVWSLSCHMRLSSPWSRVELEEGILERVVQLHDGGLVAAAVAVVGRGEDSDHVAVVAPVVALHHQLMGAGHQRQAWGWKERLEEEA